MDPQQAWNNRMESSYPPPGSISSSGQINDIPGGWMGSGSPTYSPNQAMNVPDSSIQTGNNRMESSYGRPGSISSSDQNMNAPGGWMGLGGPTYSPNQAMNGPFSSMQSQYDRMDPSYDSPGSLLPPDQSIKFPGGQMGSGGPTYSPNQVMNGPDSSSQSQYDRIESSNGPPGSLSDPDQILGFPGGQMGSGGQINSPNLAMNGSDSSMKSQYDRMESYNGPPGSLSYVDQSQGFPGGQMRSGGPTYSLQQAMNGPDNSIQSPNDRMEYFNGPPRSFSSPEQSMNFPASPIHAMNAPDGPMGPAGVILKYDLLQNNYPGTAHGAFKAFNKEDNPNNEVQAYKPEAVSQAGNGGPITLKAEHHSDGRITSGKIDTRNTWTTAQDQSIKTRGYLEVRATLPARVRTTQNHPIVISNYISNFL